jgi:hypothetical protein
MISHPAIKRGLVLEDAVLYLLTLQGCIYGIAIKALIPLTEKLILDFQLSL